jgi:penicillin-binding protein 1C
MRLVCANSGHVPTKECSHIIEDFYSVSRTLHRVCEVDKELMVSNDGKVSYCPSCLPASTSEQSGQAGISVHPYKLAHFADYPPELLTFWNGVGKSYRSVPPHNPACARVFAGDGPRIISPSESMTYYLVSPEQRMILLASSALDVKEHVWYLNETFLQRKKAGEKLFIDLKDGEHAIECVDDKGRMTSVKIRVKHVL